LGAGDNTPYTIRTDLSYVGGVGEYDYISLGKSTGRVSPYQDKGGMIFLDLSEYSPTNVVNYPFSASLTFSSPPEIVTVVNCFCVESKSGATTSASYTASGINVSATLTSPDGLPAIFVFYPIITFPFKYCTDND
jgi:hypothetical protein